MNYSRKPYHDIPSYIKKHSKSRIPDVIICLDLFVYFLKLHLLQNKKLQICRFGIFEVKNFKRKKLDLRFKRCYSLYVEHILSNFNYTNDYTYHSSIVLSPILKNVAKCLNISVRETGKIFNLFLKGIMQEIKENNVAKLRTFGEFRMKVGENIRFDFKAKKHFRDQLNGVKDHMEINKRTERMLKIHGFLNE